MNWLRTHGGGRLFELEFQLDYYNKMDMSLANGSSILFTFSKNQLLALLIFAMVSFVSFAFISALVFKISLTLGFLRD